VLEATGVSKHYPGPSGSIAVLSGIDLRLDAGESVSIVGPSGSGKSTLLHILGALDPPSAGTVRFDGVDPYALDERRLLPFVNRQVGFVFQDHHLLPQCSVLENVLVPTLVAKGAASAFRVRALDLLEQVGLAHRLHHRPPNSPAASGSAWRSPARSSATRNSCSATSRRATSITKQPARWRTCCSIST